MKKIKAFPVFILFVSLILALSFVSYNVQDLFYPHEHIKNFMGLFGAKLSSFFLSRFGIVSVLVPILLIASAISYIRSSAKFIRSLLFSLLFLFSADIIVYAMYGIDRGELIKRGYFISGSFGYILGSKVKYFLGDVGVFVIIIPVTLFFLYFGIKESFEYFIIFYNKKKKSKEEKNSEHNGISKKKVEIIENNVVEDNVKEIKDKKKVETNNLENEHDKEEKIQLDTTDDKPSIDTQFLNINDKIDVVKDSDNQKGYQFPSLELLDEPVKIEMRIQEDEIYRNAKILEEKLKNFGVGGSVVNVRPGPVVTMYEFKPQAGIKISKIANLYNDLAMAMKAMSVRIVAPIPGKAVIGIEISNQERQTVYMKDILSSKSFINSYSKLTLAYGKDIIGNSFSADLAKMPHLLIAGATGSGKSVSVNAMIVSILYKATPDEVKFVMIDPKMLELSIYDGIPHMLMPVVVDPKEANGSLAALVSEMETRYRIMSEVGVRNIEGFNQRAKKGSIDYNPMPYIVVVIDELADLMMVSAKKVEVHIARLAQMARAAGIHMIVATQRPSVDVLTGLIKANFPARISFKVSSKIDSRTILDAQGAEALLGKGDMLFLQPGTSSFTRIHGAFISDDEIKNVTDFVKTQGAPEYNEELINATKEASGINEDEEFETDDMFDKALDIIKEGGNPTISYLQRRLKIGYNRSARIVEQMEKKGILSKPDERGKREVLF